MASKLILAVAGSGKTRHIIESIDLDKRSLIITYTIANYENIKERIIKKFGYLPPQVHIHKYTSFLYRFCYQPFLQDKLKSRGIIFEMGKRYSKGLDRYLTKAGYLFHNRLFGLVIEEIGKELLLERFERFYDHIYIDEVQDFAGHDFDLLRILADFSGTTLCVGDYFQHTYDTSRDSNKNGNLHASIDNFIGKFKESGYLIDTDTLSHSWRCSPIICQEVSKLGIKIQSHREDNTEIIRIEDLEDLKAILFDDTVIKLFYQMARNYPVFSMNWAVSKGMDSFNHVCVVLNNGTRDKWNKNELDELNPKTLSKLYVAMTRARGNLYIADESMVKKVFQN